MTDLLRTGIDGTLPWGSRVYTLENCKNCKVFALASSPNLREFLSSLFSSNGATPHFVFSFRLVCDQKIFGLFFTSIAMVCSYCLLSRRINVFTLFRALVYWRCLLFASPRFIADIHRRCVLSLVLIASRVDLLMGQQPFSFHDGFVVIGSLQWNVFIL